MVFSPVDSDWLETTMHKRSAALIALAGFGLGVFVSKGLVEFGTAGTHDAPETAAAMTAMPPGHVRVAERGLGDAVMTTLQMSVAPAGDATTGMPGAATRAGSQDLVAQADELRRQRKFKDAAETYRRAVAAGGMNADSWADYADTLASAGSSLRERPRMRSRRRSRSSRGIPRPCGSRPVSSTKNTATAKPSARGATCWPSYRPIRPTPASSKRTSPKRPGLPPARADDDCTTTSPRAV